MAECIIADSTDNSYRQTELRYMICKIRRRTAYFLSFRKDIPQGLAHSHYNFIHNEYYVFTY